MLFMLCYSSGLVAQGRFYLHESANNYYSIAFKDSTERSKVLQEKIGAYWAEGFLLARIDSVGLIDSTEHLFLNKGPQYQWLSLKTSGENAHYLHKAGFKEKYFQGKSFNPVKLEGLFTKVLEIYENNGYPFTMLSLSEIKENSQHIEADLNIDKGPLVLIDTIVFLGKSVTNANYLRNYLDIAENAVYRENIIREIPLRIKESPFLQLSRETEIYFTEEGAKLQLFVEDKKANVIDGILGILPSETGDVVLSGDIRLQLYNSLKRGDFVMLNWRKLQDRTQDFKINARYPFLLNTPLGLGTNAFFYRRDTVFSSVRADIELTYRLSANNSLLVNLGRNSSSIISTAGLANISTLPDYADLATNFYGLGARLEKLDYRFSPSKGYRLEILANTGQKNIRVNPAINPEVYDSLNLSSTQFELKGDLQFFIPFLSRNTLMQRIQAAWLRNEQLFTNELFRIGGIKDLRGFDIESIFASLYTIYTLEYRFLLEQNSYLFAFGDFAYYENTALNNRVFDRPYGFGAGMSFETKAGIFSLSYALGSQQQNPILLRTGKVHFGLINNF